LLLLLRETTLSLEVARARLALVLHDSSTIRPRESLIMPRLRWALALRGRKSWRGSEGGFPLRLRGAEPVCPPLRLTDRALTDIVTSELKSTWDQGWNAIFVHTKM
jgi:hypothetical protein